MQFDNLAACAMSLWLGVHGSWQSHGLRTCKVAPAETRGQIEQNKVGSGKIPGGFCQEPIAVIAASATYQAGRRLPKCIQIALTFGCERFIHIQKEGR